MRFASKAEMISETLALRLVMQNAFLGIRNAPRQFWLRQNCIFERLVGPSERGQHQAKRAHMEEAR